MTSVMASGLGARARIIACFIGMLLALVLALGVGNVQARNLTSPETEKLALAVQSFDAAMRVNDYAAITRTIPPKVMAHIATQAGTDVETLRTYLIQQMTTLLSDVKMTSFGMDLSKAEYRELGDGSPYALIPTETVVDVGAAGKTSVKSHTLALLDGGAWYLLRVSDEPQVAILRKVYPGFVAVTFPAGSTEAVKE